MNGGESGGGVYHPPGVSELLAKAKQAHDAGELEAAVAMLTAASEAVPTDAFIANDLGAALQQLFRLPEAAAHLRRAVELNPGYAVAMNNLGVTLTEMGLSVEARSWFERAIQTEQAGALAAADLAARAGASPTEARARYMARHSSSATTNLGNLYRDAGDYAGAAGVLQTALGLPSADDGGGVVALLGLLEPRAYHEGLIEVSFSAEIQYLN